MPKKPTNPFYDKYHLFTRNNAQITIIIHQSKNLTRNFRVSIRHFIDVNTVGIFIANRKSFVVIRHVPMSHHYWYGILFTRNILNGGASFRWSFSPLSAWGSIESTTILITHPSLSSRRENFNDSTRICVLVSLCSNQGFTNRLVRP